VVANSLKSPMQERHFGNNFYIYECSLPLEASLTILDLITNSESNEKELSPTFFFGWKLLRKAQIACDSPTLGYLLEDIDIVAKAEASYRTMAAVGLPPGGVSPLQLMDQGEVCARAAGTPKDLINMLKQWGVHFCDE